MHAITARVLPILRVLVVFVGLSLALVTTYVVKSALGINVFPGRSPVVHDLLYPAAMMLKATLKTASPVLGASR